MNDQRCENCKHFAAVDRRHLGECRNEKMPLWKLAHSRLLVSPRYGTSCPLYERAP